MDFSLHQMVKQTLQAAADREKLAQAEGEASEKKKEEKGKPPAKTPPENTATAPERNEEAMMSTEGEKTSSAFVEKLASACEHLNKEFWKTAAAPDTSPVGPDKGPNTTQTNADSPTPGKQSERTGQATHNQPPQRPGSDVKAEGQTNPDTALETDIESPPGGKEDWTNQDKMKQSSVLERLRKVAGRSGRISRVQAVLNKMAADAENPASVGAKVTNPHQDSPEGATQSEEGVPSQPGETSKQESLVGSNEKAINYTKQQAKAVPKARMSEVLTEPAQRKATDPVLHENLDATSGAGVKLSSVEKVAAARALLRKIAQEGAAPGASPEQKERAAKLEAAFKAKKNGEGDKEEKSNEGEGGEGEEKTSGGLPLQGGF
jgi:hypothetical protein